jgi:hypothetical protein
MISDMGIDGQIANGHTSHDNRFPDLGAVAFRQRGRG